MAENDLDKDGKLSFDEFERVSICFFSRCKWIFEFQLFQVMATDPSEMNQLAMKFF